LEDTHATGRPSRLARRIDHRGRHFHNRVCHRDNLRHLFGVALNKEQDLRKTDAVRSKKIYLDATSPRIVSLETEAASNPNLREKTAMAAAIDETQQLSEAIAGHSGAATTQPTIAVVQARQALAQATSKPASLCHPIWPGRCRRWRPMRRDRRNR